MRAPFLLVLFLVALAASAQQPVRYSRVRVLTDAGGHDLPRLASLGLAVDHGDIIPSKSITTDLSEREIAIARANGFACEVLIADVQAFYRERNNGAKELHQRSDRALCNSPTPYPTPQHFTLGSMAGFFTWQEMLDQLDSMRAAYPQLISAVGSIGQSIEGRNIVMVRMSNNPDVDQDRPEVLYNALHHAREPASLSQLIYTMWYLLEHYGTNTEATYLLDHTELYFVPCLNPDGYVFNETNFPGGGGMWRKNRRDNGDGTMGVDLNRNYAQGWGFDDNGSSPDPASEVYRGPAPFSEPETQAIRDFCNAHQFRLAFNYHSFGNHLVYPWGYLPSIYTPDSAVFVEHGVLFAEDDRYHFGTPNQTVGYTVNGGSDDWMYAEQLTKPKILGITPEVGGGADGFWPLITRIEEIAQEDVKQNLLLAHLAGVFAKAYDCTAPILPSLNEWIHFDVRRMGLEPGPITVALEPLTNVAEVGAVVTMNNMGLLEWRSDSISITLAAGLQPGDVFSYAVAVSNGSFTFRDTLTKAYGPPSIVLDEAANALAAWQSSGWDVTTETSVSAPSSFTDSPMGLYGPGSDVVITTDQPMDLTTCSAARMDFWAKWEIESRFDLVRVQASIDGTNWTSLCGKYTRPGTPEQGDGEPIYDGQQPDWVLEEVSLDAFIGSQVRLRFELLSDVGREYDGFYFDDLKVIITNSTTASVAELPLETWTFNVMPNPATDLVWLEMEKGEGNAWIEIVDAVGALVERIPIANTGTRVAIPTTHLAGGIYSLRLMGNAGVQATRKLVVSRTE